jgi:hypothetical protein
MRLRIDSNTIGQHITITKCCRARNIKRWCFLKFAPETKRLKEAYLTISILLRHKRGRRILERHSQTRYKFTLRQDNRGVDLCQTLGGPNPFPPHPYPLPLLSLPSLPPFSSFPLSPLPLPSLPFLFPPLPWGSGGYAPEKFFSGTHARTRVLVHFLRKSQQFI